MAKVQFGGAGSTSAALGLIVPVAALGDFGKTVDVTCPVKNSIAKSMHCQFDPVSDPDLLKLVSNNGALFLQVRLIRIVVADSLTSRRPCTQAETHAGYRGYIAPHPVSRLSAATRKQQAAWDARGFSVRPRVP
jgi:hypothetical protein